MSKDTVFESYFDYNIALRNRGGKIARSQKDKRNECLNRTSPEWQRKSCSLLAFGRTSACCGGEQQGAGDEVERVASWRVGLEEEPKEKRFTP